MAVSVLLNSQVLVLNRLWQPVNTCSARRAVTLLYLGHAQVVHTDIGHEFSAHDIDSWVRHSLDDIVEEEMIHSVSQSLRIPRIIVLSLFDRLPKKQVKFTRENVFRRDSHQCQYCGRRFDPHDLNIDHVVPRDKGGRTSWDNVVCSCIKCNTRKANKMPAEARMFPRREPKAPTWRPLFSSMKKPAHESWLHFLDLPKSRVSVSV